MRRPSLMSLKKFSVKEALSVVQAALGYPGGKGPENLSAHLMNAAGPDKERCQKCSADSGHAPSLMILSTNPQERSNYSSIMILIVPYRSRHPLKPGMTGLRPDPDVRCRDDCVFWREKYVCQRDRNVSCRDVLCVLAGSARIILLTSTYAQGIHITK